jgi:hypothetical protein
MSLKITSFLFLLVIISFISCEEKPSAIPSLEFISVSKAYMIQSNTTITDSLYLTFKFTDGDGNIGSDTTDNIFVVDSRTGLSIANYKIPDYLGANPNNSSRTGEITILVYAQCCIYPNNSSCYSSTLFPTRTMQYELQIQDQSGNYSNIIKTNAITLECS